jgi:sarcosine oxidase gamma subunit
VPETKGKSLEEIEREAAERHVASAALVGASGGRVSVELSGAAV